MLFLVLPNTAARGGVWCRCSDSSLRSEHHDIIMNITQLTSIQPFSDHFNNMHHLHHRDSGCLLPRVVIVVLKSRRYPIQSYQRSLLSIPYGNMDGVEIFF